MKQHMLTHKIRDMFGNSNSGDESRMSSTSTQDPPSVKDSESTGGGGGGGSQINFAIKLEKSRSPESFDRTSNQSSDKHLKDHSSNLSDRDGSPASDYTAESGRHNFNGISKEVDIKKWCNKLNEMPENIAAS